MTRNLQQKLKSRWSTFTASEQEIAAYLLQNLRSVPFETAASLGQHVGVSAMTVGRFLRKLGYAGVAEMKDELRGDTAWLKLYRTPAPAAQEGADAAALKAEIQALSSVHALARGKEWRPIVNLLAGATRVSIASFQLARFLGISFASLLQLVRPRVQFADGDDGAYTDLLLDSTTRDCAVLIDERRYSRHFRLLAEEIAARRIPLVIISDTQCYWARQLTPHVLLIPVSAERTWHSFGTFHSLFSLLLQGVIEARGDAVYARIEEIAGLRQRFVGFRGPALHASDARAAADPARSKRRRGDSP